MVTRLALLAGLALSVPAAGCSDILGDKPNQLGEPLGKYHVVAHAGANSCGPGALGASDPWEFDIKLSRQSTTLYWDNGSEPVAGDLTGTGTFTIASSTVVPIHPKQGTLGACSVARADTAEGTLDGSGTDVPSFGGTLTYRFTPTAENDCRDVVGDATGQIASLPCGMAYDLGATRTER